MSNESHIRKDLTRWNRAGLSRFDYIDGDAANWLEELRLAMAGQFMRGAPAEDRLPDIWRDIFLDEAEPSRRAELDIPALTARIAWERVKPVATDRSESRGQRSARLLSQYNEPQNGDHSWEIMRAFARASHVLLGHLNAYANEGYLRTATQWDNLRRLAALVNYQPAPPASAGALVALSVKAGSGVSEVAPGLAMKHKPAGPGAPLIFETGAALAAHPDLNAARIAGWDENNLRRDHSAVRWIWPEKTALSPGDIVVFTSGSQGRAASVIAVNADEEMQSAAVETDGAPLTLTIGDAQLLTEAEATRTGLARPGKSEFDLRTEGGTGLKAGDLVKVISGDNEIIVTVSEVAGATLRISGAEDLSGAVTVIPLSAIARDPGGKFRTGDAEAKALYFKSRFGPRSVRAREATKSEAGGHDFAPRLALGDQAWLEGGAAESIAAFVRGKRRQPDEPETLRFVSFDGKPPKSLIAESWLVARDEAGDGLTALRVRSVRTMAGSYEVEFYQPFDGAPERTEFHGPMKTPLRPVGYDRNPAPAIPGASRQITLAGVSAEARALLRPGREFIFSDERSPGVGDARAVVVEAAPAGDGLLRLTFDPVGDLSALLKGWTLVRMNAVSVTHGESKGPKTLGSGDGEQGEQVFTLRVRDISHTPSSLSVSGVAPDMDVAVDGEAWDYRDYSDVSAEGAQAWSTTLGEDGFLRIHFRRRLPTGTDNVTLLRHRTGTGARGNLVPPLSFKKPVRKHPAVETVYQPFAASGGADREPVESLRVSAPSRLASNGRAVSLRDFERLAEGHSSVWRARAEELISASPMRQVRLTIVPAGGSGLPPELEGNIRTLVQGQAIPGVRLSFAEYGAVLLEMAAELRADLVSYERTDILAAAEDALLSAFALERRDFGQPVYIAEIHAALAAVEGVVTTRVTGFDHAPPVLGVSEAPARVARRDDVIAAIYPAPGQVAHLAGALALSLIVKGADDG